MSNIIVVAMKIADVPEVTVTNEMLVVENKFIVMEYRGWKGLNLPDETIYQWHDFDDSGYDYENIMSRYLFGAWINSNAVVF